MTSSRPLRIVLATVGSRGDVQPMLGLAQTLQAKGHVPVIAAPPNFEAWVTSFGFEFHPLGVDMQVFLSENSKLMTGNPVTMLREISRYFNGQIPVQAEHLKPACEGADAILYGGLAVVAPSIAEHLGLPVLCVLYTTCLLPSSQHPPPNIPWHGLPNWMNDLIWRTNHFMGDKFLLGAINSMRARLNLAPVAHIRSHLIEDHPVVIAADEVLLPPDPIWNSRFPYANFIFLDDPDRLEGDLEEWLDDGEPPVFVGFGSMSGEGTNRVEKVIVDAITATGRRCLVGAGWAGLGANTLPSGWRTVKDAPHALLFPRMGVVVHHGGSGTTAQALRAGVPQVVLPLILDQFHHAHRLHLAGIAPLSVPMEKITAATLTIAIKAALALPKGPREAAAARLVTSDGRQTIVRMVEELVSGSRSGVAAV